MSENTIAGSVIANHFYDKAKLKWIKGGIAVYFHSYTREEAKKAIDELFDTAKSIQSELTDGLFPGEGF